MNKALAGFREQWFTGVVSKWKAAVQATSSAWAEAATSEFKGDEVSLVLGESEPSFANQTHTFCSQLFVTFSTFIV